MFALVPLPYRILAGFILIGVLIGAGFAAGHHVASNAAEVDKAKLAQAALVNLNAQIKIGNDLSDQLAKAEATVITQTVEVIKHVPTVTTGRLCLSPDAVSLLQPSTPTATDKTPRTPVAESPPALAATDRDVVYWINDANAQYDTCALRLNALIDYEFSHYGITIRPPEKVPITR